VFSIKINIILRKTISYISIDYKDVERIDKKIDRKIDIRIKHMN